MFLFNRKMHRFYCPKINKGIVKLSKGESRHLIGVLRFAEGQKVEIFDGNGKTAIAELTDISKKTAELKIKVVEQHSKPKNEKIIIAASIPKKDRFNWLIAKCTELGVDRLIPLICQETVKKPKNPKIIYKWEKIAIQACKQCKRNFLPIIDPPMKFEDAIPKLKEDYEDLTIAHGSLGKNPNNPVKIFNGKDIAVFIGPEAGFNDNEIAFLEKNNSLPLVISSNILRIETASIAFASILGYFRYNRE